MEQGKKVLVEGIDPATRAVICVDSGRKKPKYFLRFPAFLHNDQHCKNIEFHLRCTRHEMAACLKPPKSLHFLLAEAIWLM